MRQQLCSKVPQGPVLQGCQILALAERPVVSDHRYALAELFSFQQRSTAYRMLPESLWILAEVPVLISTRELMEQICEHLLRLA